MVGSYTAPGKETNKARRPVSLLKVGDRPQKKARGISALVSFACIIHVIPTNYLDLASSKYQRLVKLMDAMFPPTHQVWCAAI